MVDKKKKILSTEAVNVRDSTIEFPSRLESKVSFLSFPMFALTGERGEGRDLFFISPSVHLSRVGINVRPKSVRRRRPPPFYTVGQLSERGETFS